MAFQNFHQIILAAGIQHPVSDAALVPRHGINEDCEIKEDEWRGGGLKQGAEKQCSRTGRAGRCRTHLWTPGSRPRGNVCRGRCGSEAHLWGSSAAGLSAPSARCCTTQSALVGSRFSSRWRKSEKKRQSLMFCALCGLQLFFV